MKHIATMVFGVVLLSTTAVSQPAKELGSRALKKGMRGADVKQLNIALAAQLDVQFRARLLRKSWRFTRHTKKAVQQFQLQHQLPATGRANPATIYTLKYD